MHAGVARHAVTALMLALPAAAQATVQTAIFRSATSGIDVTGVFGVPGRIFEAAPTTLRFYFDSTPGLANPVYNTRLTIFGQDFSFVPTSSSYNLYPWDVHDGPVFRASFETGVPDVTSYSMYDFMGVAHGEPPWYLISFVDFGILSYGPPPVAETESAFGAGSETGPSRFQIVNYVPEPASWAMMIAGFGLVGGALRRQRLAAA